MNDLQVPTSSPSKSISTLRPKLIRDLRHKKISGRLPKRIEKTKLGLLGTLGKAATNTLGKATDTLVKAADTLMYEAPVRTHRNITQSSDIESTLKKNTPQKKKT